MGRILLLSLVLLVFGIVVFYGGSYLVIFWRDTLRRWKLEKESDSKRRLKETNEEFIKATDQLSDFKSKGEKDPEAVPAKERSILDETEFKD